MTKGGKDREMGLERQAGKKSPEALWVLLQIVSPKTSGKDRIYTNLIRSALSKIPLQWNRGPGGGVAGTDSRKPLRRLLWSSH